MDTRMEHNDTVTLCVWNVVCMSAVTVTVAVCNCELCATHVACICCGWHQRDTVVGLVSVIR
jgi:hypothetical protein